MMEIRNLLHKAGSKLQGNLRYTEKEQKADLKK